MPQSGCVAHRPTLLIGMLLVTTLITPHHTCSPQGYICKCVWSLAEIWLPPSSSDEKGESDENERFDRIGFLPRSITIWLAPLLDSGVISIDGCAAHFTLSAQTKKSFKS